MAITFHNFASTPTADPGTNTADPTAVTPPANMLAGDLVFLIARASGTSGTASISQAGGQSWTALTQRNQTQCRTNCFYCRYNGNWSANPSVAFGATSNNTVLMLVFRPTQTSNTWSVDVAEASATYTAPSSPFTVTITGVTTQTNGAVVIAAWTSADDNTWGSLTGGWTALSTAQFRNTSGSNDGSITAAYMIKASAGPTGNVAQNQATLGGDAGTQYIIAFKENTVIEGTGAIAAASSDSGSAALSLVGTGAIAAASTDGGSGLVNLAGAGGVAAVSVVNGTAQVIVPGNGDTSSVSTAGGTALVTLVGDGSCAAASTVAGTATDTLIGSGATQSASSVAGNALDNLVGTGTITVTSTVTGDAEVIPGGGTIVQGSGDIVCTCTVTGYADLFLTFVSPPQQFTFGGGMTIEQEYKDDLDFLWAEMSEAERQALIADDDEVVLAATRAFVLCQNA